MDLQKQPPMKGHRILLRGFSMEMEKNVRLQIEDAGFQVVSSIATADTLVKGGGDAGVALDVARKSRLPILDWEDFKHRLVVNRKGRVSNPDLPRRAAVEVGTDTVRILDQTLRSVGSLSPLVPKAGQFEHLCRDQKFLRNVRAVALGARYGLPVALEGETAASKTTAILWLAHLLGQPVVRVNLHGQTDSGELVGRYVPSGTAPTRSSPAMEAWVGDGEAGLSSGWNKCTEDQVAAATETGWTFQECFIPRAMRQGWWVVLDEMNLAEPQVLERLNPVLEVPASLVLTEGAGTVFGPGGDVEVSPAFRVFGTMNPADYAGRSVLSPAYRDRWLIWHHAETPDEAGFVDMLRTLVFGEQPVVRLAGAEYVQESTVPLYPVLAKSEGMRDLLGPLGLFHASLGQAAGMSGGAPALGRVRRERYLFTRRTLLTCLQLLNQLRSENPEGPLREQLLEAIGIAYLQRIRDGGDRDAAIGLLRAANLAQ